MSFKTYIYALECPNTNIVKYIGKSNDPEKRLHIHLTRLNSNTPKNAWIKSLNEKPNLLILDEVDVKEWSFWEKYWISQFKTWGFKLKNSTQGGDGGDTNSGKKFGSLSQELRNKISIKTKEAMMSDKIREKCRIGNKITLSKIFDSNNKLRPDIIEKKREASKKSVTIIDDNQKEIKYFKSIQDFLKYKNISYSNFKKKCVKNSLKSIKENKNQNNYFWIN